MSRYNYTILYVLLQLLRYYHTVVIKNNISFICHALHYYHCKTTMMLIIVIQQPYYTVLNSSSIK